MSNKTTVLRRLRPPTVRPVRVIYPFQRESPSNLGYTLAMATTDPVVAPGDGVVEEASAGVAAFRFKQVGTTHTRSLRIDHGFGVKTYLHGFGELVAGPRSVTRGQLLGYSAAGEIFVGVELEGGFVNPNSINASFAVRDGQIFYQQPNYIGQAPTIIRQVVSTTQYLLHAGLSYFLPTSPPTLLFNVDFNGDGSKRGLAATGSSALDYWNVYAPVDFFVTGTACTYYAAFGILGKYYNMSTMMPLRDYRDHATKVFLERVAPLSAVAGSAASWDPMLANWIGGYAGATPYTNAFNVRGLPSGDYWLYLYADQGALPDVSYFQVSVNGGSTQTGSTTPTGASEFIQDNNYVRFALTLGSRSIVNISVDGYLAGFQIHRIVSPA